MKQIIAWILSLESRVIVARYKPFVVAVTGSVGKTATKDAIYEALKGRFGFVRKSDKSLNSEIGLPLTVIGVPNAWKSASGWLRNILAGLSLILFRNEYPDCLVLEVGADHPGDIKRLVRWLHPDVAVITKVSDTPVHVEFFSSPDEVLDEKAALALGVKAGGSVVLYADNERTASIAAQLSGRDVRMLNFGVASAATARGLEEAVMYGSGAPVGMSFCLDLVGGSAPISIAGAIGRSYVYPFLAAAAVGKACGMELDEIVHALSGFKPPKGRLNLIPGARGSTLIDDTYNSSPDAASAALEALSSVECKGSKIAILGDMLELGKYGAEEHRRIGREAAAVADRLITVGQRSKLTADEAMKAGLSTLFIRSFDDAEEAAAHALAVVKSGDTVLIKGSQSMRMERVTKALLREPDRAAELLVRQEREWLDKP